MLYITYACNVKETFWIDRLSGTVVGGNGRSKGRISQKRERERREKRERVVVGFW